MNGVFFFFNDTATTEIYTLSLHDALPIWCSITAARAPGTRSTGPCAAVPDCTASTAAPVPTSSSTRAAGPANGTRPVRETQRNNTPTNSRAMTKCTIWGCRAASDTGRSSHDGWRRYGLRRDAVDLDFVHNPSTW